MICGKMKRVFIWRRKMNHEIESYVGELRELRRKAKILHDNEKFIRDRIQWLDSDIRMGVNSDFEKQSKRQMKEFLESLLPNENKTFRVSGVPYEVEFE